MEVNFIGVNYNICIISDVNTAPVLTSTGLNQVTTVYFDETTATNTLLYTPVVYDPDAGQTHTITYTVFPAGEVDMFDVSTSKINKHNMIIFTLFVFVCV